MGREAAFIEAFAASFAAMALLTTGGCMPHDVGGKTAKDVFDPQTAVLAAAACDGDSNKVSELVGAGANVNASGFEGITPLTWALTCHSEEGMRALLESGANPNQKEKWGETAVTVAASYTNKKEESRFLRLLLDFGGDSNAIWDDRTESAMTIAMRRGIDTGNWENFWMLIDAGGDFSGRTVKVGSVIDKAILTYREYCLAKKLFKRKEPEDLMLLFHYLYIDYVDLSFTKTLEDRQCITDMVRNLKKRIISNDYVAYLKTLPGDFSDLPIDW